MNHSVNLALARLHVADLLRDAERVRPAVRFEESPALPVGPAYRLSDGSWLFGRRDSS